MTLNSQDKAKLRSTNRTANLAKLNKLFATQQSNEEIKICMQSEYDKHKTVMRLLSMFEETKFTKNLHFYKYFGINTIHEPSSEQNQQYTLNEEIRETEEENQIETIKELWSQGLTSMEYKF